jgi:hypothetical protein
VIQSPKNVLHSITTDAEIDRSRIAKVILPRGIEG